MYNPVTTYRIQFQKQFSFAAFENIIPYLQKLGVSTVYASPVFAATRGSVHGYDVLDPLRINPEIGDQQQLEKINAQLKQNGIGWLQDIVPNHMAYHPANKWLMDVLEHGQKSRYAPFFDIIWNSQVYEGRIMVPFLGDSLENCVQKGEIKLVLDDAGIFFSYFDNRYPLAAGSYANILQQSKKLSAGQKKLLESLRTLEKTREAQAYSEKWQQIKTQILSTESSRKTFEEFLAHANNNKNDLLQLANEQHYQLCYWQETDWQINFRRFFTINGLICLNMQDENVFNQYHQLVQHCIETGIFNGLRVDHVDGLSDPTAYLEQLRGLAGDDSYIIVEKILEQGEGLPRQWDIQGTTGYDFLALVNNLFTNKKNEAAFTKFYRQFVNDKKSIQQHVRDKKSLILYQHMQGELENLYRLFDQLHLADKRTRSSVHPDDLKDAIGQMLIQCPVYRFYGNRFPLADEEAQQLRNLLSQVRSSGTADDRAISLLEDVFLNKPYHSDEYYNDRVASFYRRCMQFSGPLMAKGVEDTMMYTFNRFIAHNEVGDTPEAFGISVDEFHNAMAERHHNWPLAMNTTATHDTKRGEDVRARLNVLTDLGGEWFQMVHQWQQSAQTFKQDGIPSRNDEYLVYQAMLGHYTMPGREENDFEERMIAFLQKALREAKQHSNWTNPDEHYENATNAFVKNLLNSKDAFRSSFDPFLARVADFGIVNSLAQVLLKFTCPGVPDLYQGCELWDLSFVDPDNRRAVNYGLRAQWLDEFTETEDGENLVRQLWEERHNGKIKLWLTHQLMQWRKDQQDFLRKAQYVPLTTEGAYKDHILAFARRQKQTVYIIAVPLHLAEICGQQEKGLLDIDWKDTVITLPSKISGGVDNLLTGKRFEGRITAKNLFADFPVALLRTQIEEHKRSAGILLHITSLPSMFAIGDLGTEARQFASFLHRSTQRYWQLLPINPTEAGQGHSPYSAISSMAGNPLLISPELLAKERLLQTNELKAFHQPREAHADFAKAQEIRDTLFEKAFTTFSSGRFPGLQNEFEQFCVREKEWLDDFSVYAMLKQHHQGKPWYEWPGELKERDSEALQTFSGEHQREISKIKWLQFIFFRQWHHLKDYCNNLNIQLIGDMPFYVSYDSADVWANQSLFALDENGQRTGMAGVPPDAFSADGQLWGMPVFRWDVLKNTDYHWWGQRLRKNMELFDLIRLDHFRAFDEYWEVPAGETTAKNGTWKPGPGKDFFDVIQKQLGSLPFIAEDLGEITESVYQLRDAYHLPGMKVLQFAFGGDMAHSPHINHHHEQNFLVYTGTHDNNTTVGWYRTEINDDDKRRLGLYLGKMFDEHEVHKELARLAYGSVARIAVLPMQDVLGLDENSRMNIPSSAQDNWGWRLTPGQLSTAVDQQLKEWAGIFDRQ